MDNLRIIGDVHGYIDHGRAKASKWKPKTCSYHDIIKDTEYSVQLGDMGFHYGGLDGLNPNQHVFFGGNHDNYDMYDHHPNSLGDYGPFTIGGLTFFFVRGEYSIDKEARLNHQWETNRKSWWSREQLTYGEGRRALAEYERVRPRFMITHGCPKEVADAIGDPEVLKRFNFNPDTFNTDTQRLLQAMLETHEPEYWFFGHFHKNWRKKIRNTTFICINELSWVSLDNNYRVVGQG